MTKPSGGQAAKAAKWASQKARATFRGGGTGIAATAAKHDSLIKKARWRGTEQIARETPAKRT